jgi:hypothetical protein
LKIFVILIYVLLEEVLDVRQPYLGYYRTALDKNQYVVAVLTVLSKAFDCLLQDILFDKL